MSADPSVGSLSRNRRLSIVRRRPDRLSGRVAVVGKSPGLAINILSPPASATPPPTLSGRRQLDGDVDR